MTSLAAMAEALLSLWCTCTGEGREVEMTTFPTIGVAAISRSSRACVGKLWDGCHCSSAAARQPKAAVLCRFQVSTGGECGFNIMALSVAEVNTWMTVLLCMYC